MKKMKLDIQLFNGSCSITNITETTDINTNQSTFTITAKTSATGSTYNAQKGAYMTAQWKYASGSEWTSLTQQKFSISKDSSVSKSWTLTLTHNDDGTLENINVRIKWYITSSTKGTTGATTFTPTYIPRKSDIQSITSGTTDYAPALKWTPASASFKYIIRYLYGSWTYQTDWITPNSTAQQTFNSYTITGSSIAPYMTSSTTAQVLASLYTYTSDGNLVGDSNVYFNVTLNDNIVPSASFTQVQEAGDVPSSWQVSGQHIFVKSKSRVALAINGSGAYGSSISGYRISYYGGAVSTQSATTSYLTQAGSTTFTGQVTDTRGRSASTTTTINVVDYYNPTISTAQVQRCDANGNIDNNGEYMYISYGASISPCSNQNTPSAVYKVGYRVHNTGSYQYVPLTTNANSYSASGMLFSDGIKAASSSGTKVQFSTSNTYDIIFYVKDYFIEYTNLQLLDAGFDLMNFNASGKAMAIGKVSEAGANEELLEIGMPTKQITNDKYLTSQYDGNYYWQFDTDANEFRFNKQVVANGFYTSGDIFAYGTGGTLARRETLENVSFNTIGENYPSGIYAVNSNGNAPSNNDTWYYLYQVRQDNWTYQEVIQWWDHLRTYVRRRISGTWSDWELISRGEITLYEGNSTGSITLSDSAVNYSYIEIFYQAADNYNSVKVPSPHGKRVYLTTGWFSDNSNGNFKLANVYINGTSISKVNYTALSYWNGGASANEENGIQIIKVVGYR